MGCDVLVVLAAGAGRRFGGCKQLAPVGPAGETLMDYTIHRARQAGFARVVVVTRRQADGVMREHFARSEAVEFVSQPPGVAGTVPAVLAARGLLGEVPFAVVNADDLYPLDALRAMSAWSGPGQALIGFRLDATLLPGAIGSPVNRALCQSAGVDDYRLVGLVEATVSRTEGAYLATERDGTGAWPVAGEQLVSMNAWVFDATIWGDLAAAAAAASPEAATQTEVILPVVVGQLVARGAAVTVVPVEGSCAGITWPDELGVVRNLVGELVAAGQLPAGAAEGGRS